jgi:hypothetical protein
MALYFSRIHSQHTWFLDATEVLVLMQIALSLIVTFNNFIAILGTFYVIGIWPLMIIPHQVAILGIYFADLGLGAVLANGILYMWGVKNARSHLKVFVSLMVFVTPLLLFAAGFRTELWLFGLYVASASAAIGLFFYATESHSSLVSRQSLL